MKIIISNDSDLVILLKQRAKVKFKSETGPETANRLG